MSSRNACSSPAWARVIRSVLTPPSSLSSPGVTGTDPAGRANWAQSPSPPLGDHMTIRRISSGPGLPAGFPFSLASEAHGTLYISGMPALDAAGKFAQGTFAEEADRA